MVRNPYENGENRLYDGPEARAAFNKVVLASLGDVACWAAHKTGVTDGYSNLERPNPIDDYPTLDGLPRGHIALQGDIEPILDQEW